jgi:hypothetical protein
MIHTDTFIEIGSQHKICEDYILSGENYIVLADGCSGSDDSEIGARFLCHMTKQFIKVHGLKMMDTDFANKLGTWVIYNAENLARQLGLKKTALDATLIIGYLKYNMLNICMFGDGYVVVENLGLPIKILSIDYKAGTKSMPFYLRYLIDDKGHQMYHDMKVRKTLIETTVAANGTVKRKEVDETAYDQPNIYIMSANITKSISICSDGLGTFLKPQPDSDGNKIMRVEDVVPDIFDFKNPRGVFLQRQMNIYKRKLKKLGIQVDHFDDLSIGTFVWEDNHYDDENQTEQCS